MVNGRPVSSSYGMTNPALIGSELTHSIIGAFYDVYNGLGFGFVEHPYVLALERELTRRGHRVSREVVVPLYYQGEFLCHHRLDMVVDEKVVVEAKSTYKLHEAATRQVYSYLKATHLEIGLLLHFGPKPGVFRLISRNRHRSSDRADPADPPNPADPATPRR